MRRRLAFLTVLGAIALAAPADAYVYWVNGGNTAPTIARANNDGTGVQLDFIAAPGKGTTTLAVNGAYLFWGHSFGATSFTIGRANLDGTDPSPDLIPTGSAVFGVQATDTTLYWSTSSPREVRSAGLDGAGPTTIATEPDASKTLGHFAVTGGNVFSERTTSTGAASAQVIRNPVAGGGDTVYPRTGGTLTAMITNGAALFGIRNISQANAPIPIVTAPLEPSDTVGEVVPGDNRAKYGLGLAGCRLFWSTEGPDAIGTARTDGSQLDRALITTAGIDLQNQVADVAADLLPSVPDGCEGISTTTPPPVVNPPPPVITPGPTPSPTPLPTVAPGTEIDTISDAELDDLYDRLSDLDFAQLRETGNGSVLAAQRLSVLVEDEVIRRMLLAKSCSYGPGVIGALRATAWTSVAPTPLFSGASLTGQARAGGDGYPELVAALDRQKAAQAAVTKAARRVRTTRGAKRRKAKKALRRARTARAAHATRFTLTRAPAAKKTLKRLRRRYRRGKAVKLRFATKLTDPASGNTVTRERTLTLKRKRR